jgi:hypothetical protein
MPLRFNERLTNQRRSGESRDCHIMTAPPLAGDRPALQGGLCVYGSMFVFLPAGVKHAIAQQTPKR